MLCFCCLTALQVTLCEQDDPDFFTHCETLESLGANAGQLYIPEVGEDLRSVAL